MAQTVQISGRRGRSRLGARLPARVFTLRETKNGILLDLSLTGARVATTAGVDIGDSVVIVWGEFEAFGDVVWRAQGQFGIRFDEPIEPRMLVSTRDLNDAERLPDDRTLARQTAQDWVSGRRV